MEKLSNERLEELNELRLEKGLNNIIPLLDASELELYKGNIAEGKENAVNGMDRYKGKNNGMYEIKKSWFNRLVKLEKELTECINNELQKDTTETEGNDYTVLVETLNGKFATGQIMRTISYLNKKDIGSVTKVELEERNGDIVGYVYGTNNSFRVWQSTRVSPKGKQHFKINVSKL